MYAGRVEDITATTFHLVTPCEVRSDVSVRNPNTFVIQTNSTTEFAIYVEPGGDPVKGHGQPVDHEVWSGVARESDAKAGMNNSWYVQLTDGVATSVEEVSPITSTDQMSHDSCTTATATTG